MKRAEKAEAELRDLKDAIRAAQTANEKVAKLVNGAQRKEQYFNNAGNVVHSMDEIFNMAAKVKGF